MVSFEMMKEKRNFFVWLTVLLVCVNSAVCKVTSWIPRGKVHFGGWSNIYQAGRAPLDLLHEVRIFIQQRNLHLLDEAFQNVSTPGHQYYGTHWSRPKIASLIGNTSGYRKVVQFLEEFGVTLTQSLFEDYLIAKAPIRTWERLLATSFYEFHHDEWTNRTLIRALEYSLPAEINEHIAAIFSVIDFPPKAHGGPVYSKKSDPTLPHTKSLSHITSQQVIVNGYVTPAFLSQHYNIPSNVGNSLTSQSCFESLGQYMSPSDLSLFQTFNNVPQQPINGYISPIPGGQIADAPCIANANTCAEANLDFQYIMTMAQNIPTYMIYYDNTDFVAMLQDVTNLPNPPKVVSISYGGSGNSAFYVQQFNQYAQIAGVMGITIVAASGDDGATSPLARDNPFACEYSPVFPAFSPYVLSVGATQGPEKGNPEIGCSSTTGGLITSGGGFSPFDTLPSWQVNAVNGYFNRVQGTSQQPVSGYATGTRGYPDISVIGSNYLVATGGQFFNAFGTSASAPVIAAMISLLNAALVSAGKSTVGFINPLLYARANEMIVDITEGNNLCAVGPSCCAQGFYATTGWDPMTGLGVPNFAAMLQVVLAAPPVSEPPTVSPTVSPTTSPTVLPTATPTVTPIVTPTVVPFTTVSPTMTPTTTVDTIPTLSPTLAPTVVPTQSSQPIATVSSTPSFTPTEAPLLVIPASFSPTITPLTLPTTASPWSTYPWNSKYQRYRRGKRCD